VSDGLKQRIAGAVVLGALGLVILPTLLDFADPLKIDRSTKLPPAPEIEAVSATRAERPESVPTVARVDPIFDVARSKPASDAAEQPYGLNESNLPNAWVLQVSSFVDQAKAEKLIKRLRKNDYKAFARMVPVDGQMHSRVYVGPKIDRRRAVAEKTKIDRLFKTDAIILKYVP